MNPLLTSWIVIAALLLACGGLFKAWDGAREDYLTEKASYSAFRGGVEVLGRAQEAKNKETAAKQEKISHDRYNALQGRYADIAARYERLHTQSGASSGSGRMSSLSEAISGLPTCTKQDVARLLDRVESGVLGVIEIGDREVAKHQELWKWANQQ